MADISAKLVMELRNKTGAGMSDCKNALVENDGDLEKSIDYLRKKGAASAAKRSDRDTNEGLIVTRISSDNKNAVLLSVTCETDFVSRNQDFVDYVNSVADILLTSSASTADELMKVVINGVSVFRLKH
ncbi:MAG: translation elongation factor Ts [Candidatus Kapabacteria bacterium]|nr:translation elongation factor Ts [Candidatus Kapabacteria bacterium]